MAKAKRKEYQKWYYETYTKKRRANGTVKASGYQKKTAEEKAENYKRGAEKRRQTMLERYGEQGVKEIQSASGKRLARQMAENPDKRYRPTTEKAREMSALGAEAKRNRRGKRKRKHEQ